MIEGITLSSFLQLIWMEKRTCTLTIENDKKRGVLSIIKGELKHAECEGSEGLDAALEILSWNNVRIEMENKALILETISISIEGVILECVRLQDEKNKELSIEYEAIETNYSLGPDDSDGIEANPFPEKPEKIKKHITKKKEVRMNVSKLNEAVEILKETLGGALMATDIWSSADMQSIAGFNHQPVATALFGQIINSTNVALKDSGFPVLGKYCLFDLADGKMVVLIPMGDYAWGMLVDGKKVQLGLLLNIALPKAIGAFEEAITG